METNHLIRYQWLHLQEHPSAASHHLNKTHSTRGACLSQTRPSRTEKWGTVCLLYEAVKMADEKGK